MRRPARFRWPILFLSIALAAMGVLPNRVTGQSSRQVIDQPSGHPILETHDRAKLAAEIQRQLDTIVAREKFPGGNLAIVLPDGTLLKSASGYGAAEEPLKVDDRMFCGSTGKTFVSAVALQLISAGKLSLDDRVSKFFAGPDQQWYARLPNAADLTVRSIMNHTSGLPRYLFQPQYLAGIKSEPMKSRKPTEGLQALGGMAAIHEVGRGWHYSDSNYLLLGLVIENITGKSYYDLARQRLLDPLGLADTVAATGPQLDGLVQGYIGSTNFFGLPEKTVHQGRYVMNPDFEWCGGGFVTTAGDLARWLHALHSGKVVRQTEYDLLVSPVDMRTGKPGKSGYGLGCFVWENKLGLSFGHAGIMPGYLTQIEYFPDHQIAIAFQTNTDEGLGRQLHAIVQELAKTVVPRSKPSTDDGGEGAETDGTGSSP